MDFLSFCPSLVDILLFVEPDDILRCKLVNRIINGIIQKNAKSLPRHTIDLVLKTLIEETTRTPYLLLTGSTLLKSVYITPERTILIECPKQIFELYRLHGKAEETTNENTEEELIMQSIQERITEEQIGWSHDRNPLLLSLVRVPSRSGYIEDSYERMRIYQHDRIHEGLRTIWTYIFNNYNCSSISLEEDMPFGWMNLLSECCEQNRVRCNWLGVTCTFNGLQRLVKSTDCPELRFVPSSSREPNRTMESFIKDIHQITSWKTPIKVAFSENEREVQLAVASLLQKWCIGEWSMDKVSLGCRRVFGSSAAYYGISESAMLWNFEADNLSDVIRKTVQITNVSSGDRFRDITIKRRGDKKVMEVSIRLEKDGNDSLFRTITIREE